MLITSMRIMMVVYDYPYYAEYAYYGNYFDCTYYGNHDYAYYDDYFVNSGPHRFAIGGPGLRLVDHVWHCAGGGRTRVQPLAVASSGILTYTLYWYIFSYTPLN